MFKKVAWFLLMGCVPALSQAGVAVSPKPYVLFSIGSFPITNGMLYTWIVSLCIIGLVYMLVGKPRMIPSKGQVVVESLIDGVYQLMAPITGKRVIRTAFPLLIGYFIYILMQNWSSLVPGVGTIGYYEHDHFKYFFRPSNADLNATLALAVISFVAWFFFVLKYEGIKGTVLHIFGNKADRNEVSFGIYAFLFFIFLGVGFIECISILFRLVSLSFRLYGNVFGGENLINNIMALAPWTKYLVPVPFYFLEILIGVVQALVFTLLVAVYIGSICNNDEESSEVK
jgi:F0F1-type ATP synthase, subunit a